MGEAPMKSFQWSAACSAFAAGESCGACQRTSLKPAARALNKVGAAYYLRLALKDEPGVLATVAAALGDQGVSIHHMRQHGEGPGEATVLIVTHETLRNQLDAALSTIENSAVSTGEPVAIRIEQV